MSTERRFVDHIIDQADLGNRLTARRMFGEYGFHLDGKFVAMACGDAFFIKSTPAITHLGLELPTQPPYPGAKPYPVSDKLLDDPERPRQLLLDTAQLLPEPKPKKDKHPKSGKR